MQFTLLRSKPHLDRTAKAPLAYCQTGRALLKGAMRSQISANDRLKLIPPAAMGRPSIPESGTNSINLRFKTSPPTACDPQIPIDRTSGASAFS